MDEDEFQEEVAAWLTQSFANVKEEVTLELTGNRADFVVTTPFHTYVIEVENSWDSVYEGLGQSILYAAETHYTPVVAFPEQAVNEQELKLLRKMRHAPRIVTV